MKVGTKSLLFGVHQFILHPIFVARAWYILYGKPDNPMIWLSFLVHDWGYWGKPNMDGLEGEDHPFVGAEIVETVASLFPRFGSPMGWYLFTLHHSRYLSKKHGDPFSRLCVADKLAICLYPEWLYLLLARASGELTEYLQRAIEGAKNNPEWAECASLFLVNSTSAKAWLDALRKYMLRWVALHSDGEADTQTEAR